MVKKKEPREREGKKEPRREGEIRSQGHFISTHSESQVGEQRAVRADRTKQAAGNMRFNDLSLTSASRSRKKFIVFQRVCGCVSECMYASCRQKGESSGHCTQGRKDFGFTFCRPHFSSDQEKCVYVLSCYAKKRRQGRRLYRFLSFQCESEAQCLPQGLPDPSGIMTGSR